MKEDFVISRRYNYIFYHFLYYEWILLLLLIRGFVDSIDVYAYLFGVVEDADAGVLEEFEFAFQAEGLEADDEHNVLSWRV